MPAAAEAPTPDPTTPGGSGATGAAVVETTGADAGVVGAPDAGTTAAAAPAAAAGRGMSDPNGGNGPMAAGMAAPAPPGEPTAEPADAGNDAAGLPLAADTGAGPGTNPALGAPLPAAGSLGGLGGTGGINGAAGAPPAPKPALRPREKSADDANEDGGVKPLAGEKFAKPLDGMPPEPPSPPGNPPPPRPLSGLPPPGSPKGGGRGRGWLPPKGAIGVSPSPEPPAILLGVAGALGVGCDRPKGSEGAGPPGSD